MTTSQTERILFENEAYTLTSQRVTQGEDEAWLEGDALLHIRRPSQAGSQGEGRTIAIPPIAQGLPRYRGELPVLSAMYKLAMQELHATQNARGEFTAGASWDGVWTRDSAYAIILGAALAMPEASRRSLDARVQDGRILQDTGTGGGWPISTDRVVWILAAWTYVRITGDTAWLESRIEVMLDTLRQDERILRREQGLFPGETSFLDWREQNYPDWMTPADIGASYAFGTNLLHAAARRALASLLRLLGRKEEAAALKADCAEIMESLHRCFWDRAKRVFGMIRSADGALDERPDALASSLGVLFSLLGDKSHAAMMHLPRSAYGTAVFGPSKSSQPQSYHNRTVWPFVEAYALLARAELQDQQGMAFSMASMLRASMLFGSNKENFHAMTGEADQTIQNSDGQLWSAAGMLGMFYHGLFGIRIDGRNVIFNPCVPKAYAGSHWLMGLRIGEKVIDVHIQGYGSEICSALVNGCMSTPLIPLDGEGRLVIELVVQPSSDEPLDEDDDILPVPQLIEDLPEPAWDKPTRKLLRWHPVASATAYRVFANGKAIAQTATCSYTLSCARSCSRYRIQAINEQCSSCLSVPYEVFEDDCLSLSLVDRVGPQGEYPVEQGQAWLHPDAATAQLYFQPLKLAAGSYELRVEYSNAAYSLRDGDGCALRALYLDEQEIAIMALPQQGEQDDWESFYWTASYEVVIPEMSEIAGEAHERRISLRYTDDCRKIGDNQCLVRSVMLTCRPWESEPCCASPAH